MRAVFALAATLVDLSSLGPTLHLDIRYATDRNFLGRPVYAQARAFLHPEVAQALLRVEGALRPRGYGLVIFDAYRPLAVTRLFWSELPAEKRRFVANPSKGSNHNRGCAVDASLYDLASGREVLMPSAWDEMTERASPRYGGGPREPRERRDLLRAAFAAQGFRVNPGEWWHFDHESCPRHPILDLPFEALSRDPGRPVPASR